MGYDNVEVETNLRVLVVVRGGLGLARARVDVGEQLGAREVVVVAVAQQRRGLGVERGLGVGRDEQALDGQQRVLQPQLGLPVTLERVDAHLAGGGRHVWVEDACQEVRARRRRRELAPQHQPHAEHAARVRRVGCHNNKPFQYVYKPYITEIIITENNK